MARSIAFSAGAGVLSASLMLALLAGSMGAMVLAYLTPLPLFYVGLTFGVGAAVLAGMAGTAASWVIGPIAALGYFLVFALPVAVLVRQGMLWRAGPDGSREYYPPGRLVIWLAGLAAAGLALAAIFSLEIEGGLPGALQPALERAFGLFAPPREFGAVTFDAARWAVVLPAVIAASWMLMIIINGALAQGLATRFKHTLIPSPSLALIELPHALAVVVAVAAVVAAVGGPIGAIGLAVEAIVAVPFFLQGLALLHTVAYRTQSPQIVLLAVYGVLALFTAGILLVAILGLIEQWARLRRRLAGLPRSREDE
jgi:Predicted membrane protein (DUF2232)